MPGDSELTLISATQNRATDDGAGPESGVERQIQAIDDERRELRTEFPMGRYQVPSKPPRAGQCNESLPGSTPRLVEIFVSAESYRFLSRCSFL